MRRISSLSFRGAGAKRRRTRNPVTTEPGLLDSGFSTLGLRPIVSPRNDVAYDSNFKIAAPPYRVGDSHRETQMPIFTTRVNFNNTNRGTNGGHRVGGLFADAAGDLSGTT
jgi:hypothetical protein